MSLLPKFDCLLYYGHKVSVSRQTINAMEANKYVPSTVLALKIAKVFNEAVEDVFSLDEND